MQNLISKKFLLLFVILFLFFGYNFNASAAPRVTLKGLDTTASGGVFDSSDPGFNTGPIDISYNGHVSFNFTVKDITPSTCTTNLGITNATFTYYDQNPTLEGGTVSARFIKQTTTFYITCDGVTASVLVRVGPAPAPTITFDADPESIPFRGTSNLTWTSTNTTSCTGSSNPSFSSFNGNRLTSGNFSVNLLERTTTFTLNCTGPGGNATASVTVTVGEAPLIPTVTLRANPTLVSYNESTDLSWTVTNADGCDATGGWVGGKNVNGGTETTNYLTATTVFTLSCWSGAGTVNSSVTVTVKPQGPVVNLFASPSKVKSGTDTTLTWSVQNATSCTASGDWSGSKNKSNGTEVIKNITEVKVFTLSCTGAGGNGEQTVNVTLAQTPTLNFSATPTNVNYNGATSLTWSVQNATTCTASGGWTGNKSVSGGSQIISSLKQETTFNISCTGTGGTVEKSVTVTVNPQAPVVNISASPISVQSGSSTNLTWTSTNASTCTAGGDWSGTKALNSTAPETISNITTNKTFTLTCVNAQGASSTASVSVSVILPIEVTLTATPSSVATGGTTQLVWTTTNNPTTCTARGDWSGTKGTTGPNGGGSQLFTITQNRTYTLTCTKGSLTATATAVVNVLAPLNVTLTANPNPLAKGGNVDLTWNGDNADTCVASSTPGGLWTGNKNPASGTETVNNLQQNTTFTITCTKNGINTSKSALVNLIAIPDINITLSPTSIVSGGSTTITWSVTNNPDSCTASNGWSGSKSTSGGTETINNITQNTTFTLACIKGGTNIVKSVGVTVAQQGLSLSNTRVLGGKTTLRWTATNMTNCIASTENPDNGLGWTGPKTSSPSPFTGQTANVLVTAEDTTDNNLKNKYIIQCDSTISPTKVTTTLYLDVNDPASSGGIPNYQEN